MVCPRMDDKGPLPFVLEIPEKAMPSVVQALFWAVYCGLPEEAVVRLKVNVVPGVGSWLRMFPRGCDRPKNSSKVCPFWRSVEPCVRVSEALPPGQMFPAPLTVTVLTPKLVGACTPA